LSCEITKTRPFAKGLIRAHEGTRRSARAAFAIYRDGVPQ
jgi:hypothetical protein